MGKEETSKGKKLGSQELSQRRQEREKKINQK